MRTTVKLSYTHKGYQLISDGEITGIARSRTSGVGGTYDIIIADECQFLTQREQSNQFPTKITRTANKIFTGTAPEPEFNFFYNIFKKNKNKPYFKFYGITKHLKHPTKQAELKKIYSKVNPSFKEHLIKWDEVWDNYQTMTSQDFEREHLGLILEKQTQFVFSYEFLKKCITKDTVKLDNYAVGIHQENLFTAFCFCQKINDFLYIQPYGVFESENKDPYDYINSLKNIDDIRATGRMYNIDKFLSQMFFKSKYNEVLDAADLTYSCYLNGLLRFPNDLQFLSDISEIKKYNRKSGFELYSDEPQNQCLLQAMCNAIYTANNKVKSENYIL
jgi:hypothetical protein